MLGAPVASTGGPSCHAPPGNMINFLAINTIDDYVSWFMQLLVPTAYVNQWENGDAMLPFELNTLFHGTRVMHSIR